MYLKSRIAIRSCAGKMMAGPSRCTVPVRLQERYLRSESGRLRTVASLHQSHTSSAHWSDCHMANSERRSVMPGKPQRKVEVGLTGGRADCASYGKSACRWFDSAPGHHPSQIGSVIG